MKKLTCFTGTLALTLMPFVGLPSATFAQGTSLDDGLVAYYPFDGNAEDATGNGNDGTPGNVALAPDRLGRANSAYAFLGNPQSQITINHEQLQVQPPFSFSAWVLWIGGTGNPRVFSTSGWGIDLIGTGASRLIDFNNVTWVGYYSCPSTNPFTAGTWHHVAAVRTPDSMRIYVDGQLHRTVGAAGGISYVPGLGMIWLPTLGGNCYFGSLSDAFAGAIDDVRIYNRALSGAEVALLYGEQPDPNQPPLADASATVSPVVSCDNLTAEVVLNGSLSSDPDGEALEYSWYANGSSDAIATGPEAAVVLPVGLHLITLVVSDGEAVDEQTITIEVITIGQTIEQLMDAVQAGAPKPRPLIATLSAAAASVGRGNFISAVNQLRAFEHQVKAQVARRNSALAEEFTAAADDIINLIADCGTVPTHKHSGAPGPNRAEKPGLKSCR